MHHVLQTTTADVGESAAMSQGMHTYSQLLSTSYCCIIDISIILLTGTAKLLQLLPDTVVSSDSSIQCTKKTKEAEEMVTRPPI